MLRKEAEEALLSTLLELPIVDLESLVKHFEARGHLRGLRQGRKIVQDALGEVEEKLKELDK